MSKNLLALRERIDALDTRILELLSERAQCAEEVARAKLAEDPDTRFYRPEREAYILNRMQSLNNGPLHNEQITHLYREIISSCLALEESLCIAYLGPAGTFTEEAALKHFGQAVATRPVESIDQVFREVESGRMRYGVVPVENSTEGVVAHTLDMFMQSELRVCGEVSLRIRQNLMGNISGDLADVKRVYSHQQSLAQCRDWLNKNLPHAERIAVNSNGEASRLAAKDPESLAIGPKQAAKIYDLAVLNAGIEDNANNTTRFLVIGKQVVDPCGKDKTALMVSTPNRPGSLFHILKPLAEHGVDMTRIESRPGRNTNWDYMFFLDILGHEQDESVRKAIELLREDVDLVRVLGSYPVAID